jgi:molecular chaperone Hsp33
VSESLTRYLLESGTIRIETVRLEATWQTIRTRSKYPVPVEHLLGEMIAACALLSASLKFDGSIVLQIQGDGPVRLAVAECFADLALRATAKLDDGVNAAQLGDSPTLQTLVNPSGNARCIVVLDPAVRGPGHTPYQGVVPLLGDTLADAIGHYMRQSEQVDTVLILAADQHAATGLMLQRLPGTGGAAVKPEAAEEDWQRLSMLAQTLTPEELLATPPGDVVNRLFWEEELRMFDPQALSFRCTCSRQKVVDMLVMLGEAEVDSMLAERRDVDVGCDYCGTRYVFDAVDAKRLFHADSAPGSSAVH